MTCAETNKSCVVRCCLLHYTCVSGVPMVLRHWINNQCIEWLSANVILNCVARAEHQLTRENAIKTFIIDCFIFRLTNKMPNAIDLLGPKTITGSGRRCESSFRRRVNKSIEKMMMAAKHRRQYINFIAVRILLFFMPSEIECRWWLHFIFLIHNGCHFWGNDLKCRSEWGYIYTWVARNGFQPESVPIPSRCP